MEKREKVNWLLKYMSIIWKVTGVILGIIFLLIIIGEVIMPDERDEIKMEYQVFEAEWQQILENGERIDVDLPGKVPAEWGEVISVVTTLPDDIRDKEVIAFRPVWQDVEIYVDGELRTSYTTKDSRPFGTNSAFRYVFVELTEEDAGKELNYRFSSYSKYAGVLRDVYRGDWTGIWMHQVEQSGVKNVISVFLLLLSFFCIVICFVLKFIYKKMLSLNYLAWAISLCAIWVLSESEFRQLLIKNVSVCTNLTYLTLILIPIPLMLYINDIQEHRYSKVYALPLTYCMVILFVLPILQLFEIKQFVEMLIYSHFGIAVVLICIIVTITLDFVKKRASDYFAVGIGLYGLLFTAVLEIVLYYIGSTMSLGTILVLGLVFLLVMAIIKTGQDLVKSEKKKQQAIVAREAQAKFLANMSHEIRTPINAVLGMNEMVLRESQNPDVQSYAQDIQSASNMLLGLVNDILDFSKIESGQMELNEYIYSFAPMIRDELLLLNTRASGKPISTHVEIDPEFPSKFYGDELRIKQVLTNLLSNAVKYTKEGEVTLIAGYKYLNDDTAELSFAVKDTGIGIQKEDLEKLFDSFKRLELNKNRNVEGTGLGLNIAKQLVELMGGIIEVDSVYGKGSTFTVIIPQQVVDKTPVGKLEDVLRETKKATKKSENRFKAPDASVLVVDDNSMNLSVMKGLLKRTQIQLDMVKSGKECLEVTKNKKYDMILMDHMMPEMDGVETLHHLRKDNSNPNQNAIVVALTANAIAGCREMYLEYGFNDYFSKPIRADKLDELLLQYLPGELILEVSDKSNSTNEVESDTEGSEASEEGVDSLIEIPASATEVSDDLLYIDRTIGLSYCMDNEELYQEILTVFCEDCPEYISNLQKFYEEKSWKEYETLAHSLKSNAKNIGAVNFSDLSLKHELAAKEENEAFIVEDFTAYRDALEMFFKKVQQLLDEVKMSSEEEMI